MAVKKPKFQIQKWESVAVSNTEEETYVFNGLTCTGGEITEYQYTQKEGAVYWIKNQPFF